MGLVYPTLAVKAAFSTAPLSGSPVWTDITPYVLGGGNYPLTIRRGRSYELDDIQPGTLSLWLNDDDGRFTPERAASPYYPNVQPLKRVRVEAVLNTNPSFETNVTDWTGFNGATITRDTAQSYDGLASMRVTPNGTTATPRAESGHSAIIPGASYLASAWVWSVFGWGSTGVSVTIRWYDSSHTFISTTSGADLSIGAATWTYREAVGTAPANAAYASIGVQQSGTAPAANYFNVDAAMLAVCLFDGHINRWQHAWESTTAYGRVQLTATDALMLASRRQLRSFYEEEILLDSPAYYWTLADSSESTYAAESSGKTGADLSVQIKGRTDPNNGGGTLDFGSGTGPGVDGLSAVSFTSGTDGRPSDYRYLLGPADVVTSAGSPSVSYEVSFAIRAGTVMVGAPWLGILGSTYHPSGDEYVSLAVDASDGALSARWAQKTGGTITVREVRSTGYNVWNSRTHHVIFVITDDFAATSTTGTLYVDGMQRATATFTGGTHGAPGDGPPLYVGRAMPGRNYRGFDGTISHVAVFPQALTITGAGKVTNHYQAEQGWPGQTTDVRVAKIASLWGYPTTSLETGNSTLAGQPVSGQDIASALKLAAVASEDGLIFIDRTGALKFQNRWHRINRAVGFTVTAAQIRPGVAFGYDDTLVRNRVTASLQGSTTAAGTGVTASDAASIAVYDVQSESVETCLPQTQLAYRAQAFLEKASTARIRADQGISIIPDNATLAGQLLALEVGDSFAVSGLPSNGPATTLEFDVDGITHEFTLPGWTCEVTTSPRPLHLWAVTGTGPESQAGSVWAGW